MATGGIDTEQQLGDFKLLRKLGEGAAGVVYRARQISFERDAAVKVLCKTKSKHIERFYREARLAGSLDHPHIVQGYAVGEERGVHYFAMEYVRGHSLQHWLGVLGRLPVGEAVHVTLAVARALEYAHSQKLVHRDIKPANVLIGRDGAIKLTDLGMAKIRDVDVAELTRTGRGLGTPCYMPIEQFVNAKDADARCDIYALGCMLYALLTGQPPFVSPSFMELIQAKEASKFSPARQVNPEVPESLDTIIARMIARRPEDRYQSCTEAIHALDALKLAAARLQFQRRGELKTGPAASPASGILSKEKTREQPREPDPAHAGPQTNSLPLADMPTRGSINVSAPCSSPAQPAPKQHPKPATSAPRAEKLQHHFWHWLAWFALGVGISGAILFGAAWLLLGW